MTHVVNIESPNLSLPTMPYSTSWISHRFFTAKSRVRLPHTVRCSCSPMDKAHDYGSCICRFESCQELKIWSVGREADCTGLLIRRSDTDPEVRILHTSSYMLQSLRWWSRGPENRQPGRAMQVRILPAALRKLESLMQAFFFCLKTPGSANYFPYY